MERKPTILIVEDEAGPRESLLMTLKPLYEVHCAETGKEALEILSEKEIDGVTLDLKLPDTDGSKLLGEIKKSHPSVEIIIITGDGDIETAKDAVSLGAFSYLLKPFNISNVLDCVNRALDKKARLDKKRGSSPNSIN